VTDSRDAKLDDETMVLVSVAKRQWERTFDAISESLMIVDNDYVIRRANVALADELGLAIQRVVGQRCYEVRSQSPRAFLRSTEGACDGCPVADAQRTRAATEGEVRSKEGRTNILRAFPLPDEKTPMTVCHYHDVTDEREMTRELASAEKLASIGRLAGGVAHEINNPLAGILACAEVLQRGDVSEEERRDYLADIRKSALRCKAIVESLLRFSRQVHQTHQRKLSLNDVVEEAARLFGHKLTRAIPASLALASDLPPVLGDANQLQHLVMNLLGNAYDSTDQTRRGGQIQIATSSNETDVILTISDSGSGIADENLAKLFDPFFTTKEEGKGAGLGLAVSYAIVQEHGGRITAANRPEGGASFVVTLPRMHE
jgi:C4-dicarboxylate-specific signal transduction histidine kinase